LIGGVEGVVECGRKSRNRESKKQKSGLPDFSRGWLMKGRSREWKPPLPGPLLHKCVEEREKTPGSAFMSQR
jgi:hypothetical protein